MPKIILLIGSIWLLAQNGKAQACGSWNIMDLQKNRNVYFGLFAVSLSYHEGNIIHIYDEGRTNQMVALTATPDWKFGDPSLEDAKRKADFRWEKDTLRYLGKPVATVTSESFVLDGRRYTASLKYVGKGRYSEHSWKIDISLSGTTVITGLAENLPCVYLDNNQKEPDQKIGGELVLRRIIIYLAWRELIEPQQKKEPSIPK